MHSIPAISKKGEDVKKVVIIGAGVIGSSIAWRVAREGVAVTVLEKSRVGNEASWASAGMIAPQAEAQAAGPFFDFCMRARDHFESTLDLLRTETEVDPEYDHVGLLYLAFNATERQELEHRARWQIAAGGRVEELTTPAARAMEPAVSAQAIYALHMPLERRVENRRLNHAYASAGAAKGAVFVEGAAVKELIFDGTSVSGVRTHDGRRFEADMVINAAGSWVGEIGGIADKVETYPVRGQVVCFEGRPGTLHASIFSHNGYLVPRRDGRIIAGSTMEEAGYDKSVTLAGLARITRGAIEMVPGLGELRLRETWAGLRPATRDFLPVIGPSPSAENYLYATGHFRSGILLSAITGEIVADLVQGRKPPEDIAPFAASRFAEQRRVRTVAVVRDILFRSRIDAAAQALGTEVDYASDIGQAIRRCRELEPTTVFFDLSDGTLADQTLYSEIRAGGARLVGFASHVDLKSLGAARNAGFDLTLSRSEFVTRLPELLKSRG
jgi:glycine oxidase